MRKYTLDESVFENINTEEKAYWLGFILADGSIGIRKDSNQHTVKIALQTIDKNHLDKFCSFLNTNMPIKIYKNFSAKSKDSCEIAITSKKIVQDLMNLGIGPKKSHTVEMPIIRKDLSRHLIRGIWDGDGSVLYRATRKKYPNNITPIVQICGNEKILNSINEIFEEELNLKKSKLSKVSSIFLFRKSTKSAQKIINYLYKDCSIALDRKLDKARQGMSWVPRKEG